MANTPQVARKRPAAGTAGAARQPAGRTKADRLHVTALARGLQILRCFSHERPELSPQEIVRMTGLPQPTVWRLCHTRSTEGFLICPGNGTRMSLGLPALALGYSALVRQALPKVALPYMEQFTARHRMGMSLGIRDGLDMLYLQRTHGDFVYLNDPVGARRPFATAPTGWACYAAYGEDERKTVRKALKQRDPSGWTKTETQLAGADEDFRRHGCVLSLGAMHAQMNAIAVPIRSLKSDKVYALSASGLATVWPRKKLLAVGTEIIALARDLAVAAD